MNGSRSRLEQALHLMVGVGAVENLHVHRDPGFGGHGTPEILHQLGAQIAHFFPAEIAAEDQKAPAAQIHYNPAQRLVQGRKGLAETVYPGLVADCFGQSLSQHDAHILHSVVLVDMKVALAGQLEVHSPVPGKRGKHVLEKAHADLDSALSAAVNV